jgi:hypothetical protein
LGLINQSKMLDLNDPEWQSFEGGYRQPYDASVALTKLEKASNKTEIDTILNELWEELHHQGDVGVASYMSVPHLVRIALEKQLTDSNIIALITVIEIERHKNNPPIPVRHQASYLEAIGKLAAMALNNINENWDLETTAWRLAAVAASKGQTSIANAISKFDSYDMIEEFLEEH